MNQQFFAANTPFQLASLKWRSAARGGISTYFARTRRNELKTPLNRPSAQRVKVQCLVRFIEVHGRKNGNLFFTDIPNTRFTNHLDGA